ncbi:hypothetical protein ACVWZ4_004368 [Bradyrhizobium sp. USDA 4472]
MPIIGILVPPNFVCNGDKVGAEFLHRGWLHISLRSFSPGSFDSARAAAIEFAAAFGVLTPTEWPYWSLLVEKIWPQSHWKVSK